MISNRFHSHGAALTLCGLLLLGIGLAGCSSARPLRPYGNLGDTINSAANDFALAIRPDRRSVYFTSDRSGNEDIWGAKVDDPAAFHPAWDTSQLDLNAMRRLSQPTTNDGAMVFIDETHGFFASGHAPDTLFAKDEGLFGGIIGGTDIFEFSTASGLPVVRNLGPAINSDRWDSHPTVASTRGGDSLLMIFASDRPNHGAGFSSPYARQLDAEGNVVDSTHGNTDIYYAFRIGGVWGPVRNFADIPGGLDVNTRRNEYSPFLYCIGQKPRLLFSSNREGSYDIFQTGLSIDFAHASIAIAGVSRLPFGADSINTDADERFPFIADGAEGGARYLYFSSNRDQKGRAFGDREIKSVGGFDIYRMPFSCDCHPPKIRYEVTVLNADNPAEPVRAPLVRLYRLRGDEKVKEEPSIRGDMESRGNPTIFTLDYGTDYGIFGGSSWDSIDCAGGRGMVEYYVYGRERGITPVVAVTMVPTQRDSLFGVRRIVSVDTVVVDTVSLTDAASIAATASSTIERVARDGEYLLVTRHIRERQERITGGTMRTVTVNIPRYDTLARFDTVYLRTGDTFHLAPSARVLRYGASAVPISQSDITIRDTIMLRPKFYTPPLCEWLYTRDVPFERNVPYFQTGFWEVNTSAGLERDRRKLASGELADANFIELHPANNYFGTVTGEKRERRVREYTAFAQKVDHNLNQMASELTGQIIPEYLEFEARSKGSNPKLVIQILAFSDFRPVQRGYYAGGERVRYVGGRYDAANGALTAYDVDIPAGASLVGQDNDTLSKLRAYFGYRELLKHLERDPVFSRMIADGTVLLPFPNINAAEYMRRMSRAKIIVTMEGRFVDGRVQPTTAGYTDRKGDYYDLDDVRRIDVQVNRLEYDGVSLRKSPCCSEPPPPKK
ncbi:MAG: hypothetical protein ABIR47_08800 [Candidatus Kapaibacterium sp.]